jgi:uncharacterized protein (DUF433 family)
MPKTQEAQKVEVIPIHTDKDGVNRVSRTRVTLDTIIATFQNGATAEEISLQYPTVPLADIYAVIGYYLHHVEEVEAYLVESRRIAQEVRALVEQRWPREGIRERLLARDRRK